MLRRATFTGNLCTMSGLTHFSASGRARLVHRVTTVRAGDNIVFIAAAAEHRAAAFEGCRWIIDELKQRVPVWKKEITPQGEAWVTPHP